MKKIDLIKAYKIRDKFKEIWITLSVIDIQVLFSLLEIYKLWMKWELIGVEKINNDYIFINNTQKLIDNYYSDLRILKSSDYFSMNKFDKLWLLERKVIDSKYSHIKPTELMNKLIK